MAQHVDLNAQALTSQTSELRNEISIELDTIRPQITTLQSQVTTLQENVVSAIQQIGAYCAWAQPAAEGAPAPHDQRERHEAPEHQADRVEEEEL